MKYILHILSILALGLASMSQSLAQAPANAPAPAGAQPPDQISQLAEMVGLSDEQEKNIRAIIAEIEPNIERLQTEAQAVHADLMDLAGPDFDEAAIRAKAAELGALEGQMTASSIILQSKVDAVFTEEQRKQLEEMQRQQQMQQQQMQQMQQQQMQQQIEQQMQQMQKQMQQQQATEGTAEPVEISDE